MFEDLELPDEDYYKSLKSLLELDNVEDMCLDFTFTENALGENRVVDLIEGGSDVALTNYNLPEYLEANLMYHLMDRVKPQLKELLLGFYDVIPEPLLTIFDFQELELVSFYMFLYISVLLLQNLISQYAHNICLAHVWLTNSRH